MYQVGQEEIDAIARVIRSGALFRYGVGSECDRFEARYAEYLGVKHFALAASGSNALAAAMTAVGLGPGDEVHHSGPHLHGDRDLGADPPAPSRSSSTSTRAITIDPGGDRGRDRAAHPGRRSRPHVGRGLRHGRDHGRSRGAAT